MNKSGKWYREQTALLVKEFDEILNFLEQEIGESEEIQDEFGEYISGFAMGLLLAQAKISEYFTEEEEC